jgi:hypothetical protein
MESKIEKIQKAIIESIEQELSLEDEFYKPQPMFSSVWFYPELGFFMYADAPVIYDVIYPLIKSKKLVYKGIELHQGISMVRYVLK